MTSAADRLYDQVLALRCQAGDDLAFAELVERYHRRLRYYVLRLLGDADAADDGMQDVWLTVFAKLPQLRSPRALPVWLYRIARNATFRTMRDTRSLGELSEEPIAEASTSDEPDFSPQDAARVHAALDRLRPHHKEVLAMRFVEQLDYEQIAEVIGCPIGTVRSRLYYAKRELRREMGG